MEGGPVLNLNGLEPHCPTVERAKFGRLTGVLRLCPPGRVNMNQPKTPIVRRCTEESP